VSWLLPGIRVRAVARGSRLLAVGIAGLCAWGVVGANAAAPARELLAFGNNQVGQLGSTINIYTPGSTTDAPNPTPMVVRLPGRTASVRAVAAGLDSALVVTSSGQLFAFGSNSYGQLGVSTNAGIGVNRPKPNPRPVLVALPGKTGKVTKVAVGSDFSLVLTSSGQLYTFGDNQDGQLGNSTNLGIPQSESNPHAQPNPTPTPVTLPAQTGRITQIAAGAAHSLVLTSTGQVYAFGYNGVGQLGNSLNMKPVSANPTPTLVMLPGLVGRPTHVAAGFDDSLVTTSSGQLYAFGGNRFGELGTSVRSGTTNGVTPKPTPTPTLVKLPGRRGSITQVAAGADFNLVVTSTGQLYAFGDNIWGELGSLTDYRNQHMGDPTPTLVVLPGQKGTVRHVAAGGADSLIVTSSGQLYAFGWDISGELGTAPSKTTFADFRPTLVALPAGTKADSATAGYDFSFAIVSGK